MLSRFLNSATRVLCQCTKSRAISFFCCSESVFILWVGSGILMLVSATLTADAPEACPLYQALHISFSSSPLRYVLISSLVLQASNWKKSVWFDSLRPSQQFFSYVHSWNGSSWVEPVLSKDKCDMLKESRTRHTDSDACEAQTRDPSVSSQALYHCDPSVICNCLNFCQIFMIFYQNVGHFI